VKLTDDNMPAIEAAFAASGKADKIYFDDTLPGFGIRLRTGSKKKIWLCRYEHIGVQRKYKIGDVSRVTADQARKKAKEVMAKVTLGLDPQADKAEERRKAHFTLRAVANQYLQRQEKKLAPKSLKEAQRYLLKSFRSLHAMPLHKIARRDIAVVLTSTAFKNGPIAAARSRAILSALFTWAKGEGLLDGDNPVIGTNNPAEGVSARTRVLSDGELAAVWKACGDDESGRIVKLLILTGARREEVGGMRWAELDRDNATWTIPASRTKNRREHILTLPGLAWSIIEQVVAPESTVNNERHLFGFGQRGYNNWDKAKKALDGRCQIATPWRLHDLRRTVATRMADLGVQPHIIEAVLNHVSGHKAGVAGVYNRSAYTREVKNALAIWADHVASITTGEERKILAFPAETG
jgi:integrase